MPTLRFAPPLTISRIVRAAGNVPAPGVVPTSGTSPDAIPAGRIAFETHVLLAHANPTINTAAFPALLASTLYEQSTTRASAVASDIAISTAPLSSSERDAMRAAMPSWVNIGGSSAINGWMSARWVNVRGSVTIARAWTLTELNRAIAVALADSIAWNKSAVQQVLNSTIPNDGDIGAFYNAFTAARACEGRRAYTDAIPAACTRWTTVAATVAPQPPREGPVSVTLPQCRTVTEDGFWLRPTATFAHTGPKFPANTPIELLERTEAVQGVYRLFRVAVANPDRNAPSPYLTGYAALRAADLARSTCAQSVPNGVLTNTYSRQSGGA